MMMHASTGPLHYLRIRISDLTPLFLPGGRAVADGRIAENDGPPGDLGRKEAARPASSTSERLDSEHARTSLKRRGLPSCRYDAERPLAAGHSVSLAPGGEAVILAKPGQPSHAMVATEAKAG